MQPQASAAMPLPPGKSSRTTLLAVVLGVLFILALAFGYWAFTGRQDYKNKSDAKVAAAVASAQKAQAATDQAKYDQASKAPYKTYQGSATYGSISFNYPKTWSGYVDTTGGTEPINGYFYPDVVPAATSSTAFALRLELVNTSYSDTLNQFQSQITSGSLTSTAYVPPKLQGVTNVQTGVRLDGVLGEQGSAKGSMVVLKVRDKTLEIYTQSQDFSSDFNNIVLPSLTFSP